MRDFANLDYLELLPYHRFAEAKYQRLERDYALQGAGPPSQERLEALGAVAEQRGIRVKLAHSPSK